MPASVDQLSELDQFYHAYGKALSNWAAVEFQLCAWFERCAGLSIGRSEAIFFSGRSFQTRAEMLSSVIHTGKISSAWAAFIESALTKAITYNSFRNHIAHAQLESEMFDAANRRFWKLRKPQDWRESGGADQQSLINAAQNFEDLAEILRDGHWLQLREQPTREFLQRLDALPNEADSNQLSRKQKGRERQRQAALRSKGGLP
jgi:hypothetical protein